MGVYFIRIVKSVAVTFLSGIFLISVVEAYEIQYLKAEVFKIPSYNSGVPSGSFSSIGIDGKTGNVCLANDYGCVKYHIETASLILKAPLSLLQRDTNLRQSQVAQVEHMFLIHCQTPLWQKEEITKFLLELIIRLGWLIIKVNYMWQIKAQARFMNYS